jgi:nitrite reductase/ring-hydroxylating ferredoxin subunit
MATYVVATVDEIPPGGRKILSVGGRSIGVFNVGGEYFALLNRCPHQAGPLCEGKQHGLLEADVPGEYRYSRPGEILRCPWHGWEYDLRTGQSWFDPAKVRVRRYEAGVQPGSALLANGWQPGPYVAETFPVTVEQEYVVVEMGAAPGVQSPPRAAH